MSDYVPDLPFQTAENEAVVWIKSTIDEHYLEREKYRNFVSRHLRSRYCRWWYAGVAGAECGIDHGACRLSNPGYSCCDADTEAGSVRAGCPDRFESARNRQIPRLTW